MAKNVLTGLDVDTDALAEDLRQLADDIEANDVGVTRVTTAETASTDDAAVSTLMVRFARFDDADRPVLNYITPSED